MIRKVSLWAILLGGAVVVAVNYSHAATPKKFPKKGRIVVKFDLLPGGPSSAPVTIPFDTPVQVVGVCTTPGFRSVGQVSLLRAGAISDFLVWVGLDSTPGAAITEGLSSTPGAKIVYLDQDHTVQIEVNDATSFRVASGSAGEVTGTITVIW